MLASSPAALPSLRATLCVCAGLALVVLAPAFVRRHAMARSAAIASRPRNPTALGVSSATLRLRDRAHAREQVDAVRSWVGDPKALLRAVPANEFGCNLFTLRGGKLHWASAGPKHQKPILMHITFANMLLDIGKRVRLPDVVLPLNSADEPMCERDAAARAQCACMSFCRHKGKHADLLLPHPEAYPAPDEEPDMFAVLPLLPPPTPPPATFKTWLSKRSAVVWRGTYNNGIWFGRDALVDAARELPDRIDAGYVCPPLHWPTDKHHRAFCFAHEKPRVPMQEQFDSFRYVVNAAGNCASVRLGPQLRENNVVLLLNPRDGDPGNLPHEMHYSVWLGPHEHYVPVGYWNVGDRWFCVHNDTASWMRDGNETRVSGVGVECKQWAVYATNFSSVFAWIDEQPAWQMRSVLDASERFAEQHLSTAAIDAYVVALLEELARAETAGGVSMDEYIDAVHSNRTMLPFV